MGVDVAGWGSLVLPGGGEPGQRAHRSALVGKDPDVALRAGERDRLGQRASVRPLDGPILRPDLPTGGAEWTRISPQDSTPMPPSGDAQAPCPLLACLGEGSTHTAAGQEPLPSEPSGARPVAPARAPRTAGPSPASLSDERGDLDDSYPVHPAPRRDLAAGRLPRRGGPAGHPRRAGPDMGTHLAVQQGARGPCRAAGLDPEPGRAPADRPPPAQPRRTPGRAQAATGTPRPRPAAAAAAAGQPGQRLKRK